MTRREFPASVKREAWRRCGGFCESCHADVRGRRVEYDHVIPDGTNGKPTLENCEVLCKPCHDVKTGKVDAPRISKTRRVENKVAGITTRRKQKIGDPRFRRKVDGSTVRREE